MKEIAFAKGIHSCHRMMRSIRFSFARQRKCVRVAAQYRLAMEGSRKEDVLQAEAAFRAAEADYKRMKDLLESQTITRKQFDDVEARYIAAEQTYPETASWPAQRGDGNCPGTKGTGAAHRWTNSARESAIASSLRRQGVVTLRAFEPGRVGWPGDKLSA